ncbi:MAG: 50S ribosomal protein L25/general stress protein Ctc [Acidothermaceae bacterium]
MSEVRISAEPRSEFGKGAARRVRRGHKVPAVLYGHGTPPQHISLPGHELMLALKSANVLLRLEGLDGGSELALPKAVQRDAVSGMLEHVDLLLVRLGEKVTIDIPLQIVGNLVPDGFLDQQLVSLSIEAEATHIPQQIEVSIEGLQIGQSIHASEVALPEGSSLQTDAEAVVVHITGAQTAQQFEAELAEVEAEAGITPTAAPEAEPESEPAGAAESAPEA